MNTQQKDVVDTSIQAATLFAELASVENDLIIMFDFQQKANQAAIWTFNAWATTDAFIEREKSLKLIQRLEKQSSEADAIKTQADLLVSELRERKRKLTRKLKSKVYSPEMQAERERAEQTAKAQSEAILEAAKAESEATATNTQANDAQSVEKTTDEANEAKSVKTSVKASKAKTEPQAQAVETVKPKKTRSTKKQNEA
jgi:hypothetical protein